MAVRIQDGSGNSLTSTANALDVNVKFSSATQPVSAAALPLPAGASQDGTDAMGSGPLAGGVGLRGWLSSIFTAMLASYSAKQVLAANITSVQQPKDTGRTRVLLLLTKTTAITAEALVTLTQKRGTASTTTGTTYTVTAGKTLRIQTIFLNITNITTATAPIDVAIRMREGAAGGAAVSATSDIISELETGVQVATATLNAPGSPTIVNFPDGLEIASGQQIGVTEIATSVNAAVTLVITGFEY